MRIAPLALLAAGLALTAPALATGLELKLETYDLRKCLQWSITRVEQPVPQPVARSAAYRAARARARSGIEVFQATAELPEGGSLHKYGACSYRRMGGKPRLGCVPVLDFPLAGASYLTTSEQRFHTAIVLRCVAGCDQKIPDLVYELHEEGSDLDAQEKEERARGVRLRRACAGLR